MILALKRYTLDMARWASELRFDDIPDRVVEECKTQALSVLAAVFAGSRTAAGKTLTSAVREWGNGGGKSTMIPSGAKVSVNDAILANAALSMALDYDDYLLAGHTGHSAVLVPLALGESLSFDGRDFITAQTVANEIEARIGASVIFGPHNGQMWAFIHAAGAAAAAARLLRLDPEQTASAIAIALSQPNYVVPAGFMYGESKLLTAAWPAVQGVCAARFAKAGLSAADDILENKDGFCRSFSYAPVLPALTNFGKTWLSDTLSYKIYPGCAYIDAPVDCILEIMNANGLDTREISRVDIHASVMTQKMDEMSMPFVLHTNSSPTTLNFSVPYNAAAAIFDGKLGPEQFTRERIADDALWKLARKVRVHHDVKYTTALLDNVSDLIDIRGMLGGVGMKAMREVLGKLGISSPMAVIGKSRELSELIREGGKAFRKTIDSDGEDTILSTNTAAFKMAFGARVTIETAHGSYSHEQEVPFGAAGWNLEQKRLAVINKFEKESYATLEDEAANSVFSNVLSLDTLDAEAVRDIAACCVPA